MDLLIIESSIVQSLPFSALDSLRQAMTSGHIDLWLLKGWEAPEELLYPQVQEVLTAWTKAHRPRHQVIRIVGEQWSPLSHELREALARNTIPFQFHDIGSQAGNSLVEKLRLDVTRLPVAILRDDSLLYEVKPNDIAPAIGLNSRPTSDVYDVVILGAGPAGLSAAVYSASEGLRALVVEPKAIGGQAATSSMIRNYLGFPRGVAGGELGFRAFEQALLFGAEFLFMHQAVALEGGGELRTVTLEDGTRVKARTVVIAAGVEYRRLAIPALERLVGVGVFYGAAGAEAPGMSGQEAYVVGGANSAGQAALHLSKFARRVTLLVRANSLEAGMSEYLISQLRATANVEIRLGTRLVDGYGRERLERLTLEEVETGHREEVNAARVFVMIGAEPRTGWLEGVLDRDESGFILTGVDLAEGSFRHARSPLPFDTSLEGVFAVGDTRHGSVKRVAGAVGEGSVAIGSVHRFLAGAKSTSTSGSMVAKWL